jgi:septal ring factor EnvC (AmiA/AmiB activator)
MLKTNYFPVQGGAQYTNDWGNPRSGGRQHRGTDLFAAMGTPVVAVTDGKVTAVGNDGGAGGLRIWLGGKFYYAHLSGVAKGLKVGQMVKAGPGTPVGPPTVGVPGPELPGSSVIPFREPGSSSELWQLVSPQSREGQRFLDLASAAGGEQ